MNGVIDRREQDTIMTIKKMAGASRRKKKLPRKILRVLMEDGSCALQTQFADDRTDTDDDEIYVSADDVYRLPPPDDEYMSSDDVINGTDEKHDDYERLHTNENDDVHSENERPENERHRRENGVDSKPCIDSFKSEKPTSRETNDLSFYKQKCEDKSFPSQCFKFKVERPDKEKVKRKVNKHQHPEPTAEFPYQCDVCDMLFKSVNLLTDHQMTVHENNRQFVCRYCSKKFNDKYNMRKHVLIHVGEKRHKCPYCDKAFLRKDHLRSHLQTHYNRKYGCKVCGKGFRTMDMYEKHARLHKDEFNSMGCSDNLQVFSPLQTTSEREESRILANQNKESSIPNNSDEGQDTQSMASMDEGSRTSAEDPVDHHPNNWPYSPGVCSENEQQMSPDVNNEPQTDNDLVKREDSPTNFNNNKIVPSLSTTTSVALECASCKSTFSDKLTLQVHENTCTGHQQKWHCLKCNIVFDEASTLRQHYDKVHTSNENSVSQPTRWKCKMCNIDFPNSKDLSRHYSQSHKDAQLFPCSECSKTFTVWHNLKKHMLIHVGDKKHKCHVCHKGFVRKDHLNSHMKVHTSEGVQKFTCKICTKVFRLKHLYNKHMALHGLGTLEKSKEKPPPSHYYPPQQQPAYSSQNHRYSPGYEASVVEPCSYSPPGAPRGYPYSPPHSPPRYRYTPPPPPASQRYSPPPPHYQGGRYSPRSPPNSAAPPSYYHAPSQSPAQSTAISAFTPSTHMTPAMM